MDEWYWKSSQIPEGGEFMDVSEEPTTAILLDQHNCV